MKGGETKLKLGDVHKRCQSGRRHRINQSVVFEMTLITEFQFRRHNRAKHSHRRANKRVAVCPALTRSRNVFSHHLGIVVADRVVLRPCLCVPLYWYLRRA